MASWSEEELAAYRRWFSKVPAGEGEAPRPAADVAGFLTSSGLGRGALKQVWAVANPGCKTALGFEEFARCCRLIGHVQALGKDAPIVAEGDRPLRVKLREECLIARPPALPSFMAD